MHKTFLLLILSTSIFSCSNTPAEIGADFFNGSVLDVAYTDSVSVKFSSIRYEELVTNSPGRLLVGHHEDEKLGALYSASYFQLSTPTGNPLNKYYTEYNYMVLVLKYDEYTYYDTLLQNRFHVYRVNEEIEADDDGYLYNHSSFSLESNPLGDATFKPRPHKDDSLAIRLDDALGRELYDKVLNETPEVNNNAEFQRYFRGIAVLPDTSLSASLVGFTTNAEVRIYYKDKSTVPVTDDKYISFPLNSSGPFSNRITADMSTTKLEGSLLSDEEKLDASVTDNESYVQGGTGLALRLDFPYIKMLRDVENFHVTNAVLEIHPAPDSYDGLTPLPDILTALIVHPNNTTYTEYSTRIQQQVQNEIPRNTYYSIDVTDYIKTMLRDETDDEYALLFRLQDAEYSKSVNRIFASNERSTLRIYYATIKNN
jgi:hypothetical protein